MTHASLCSGIDGFAFAAKQLGWINKFYCEVDEFCLEILKHHYPNSKKYTDVKQTDFTIWRGHIDVLSAGFPCQPFSNAGRRKGTEDDRHLWPEIIRAIREVQPCYFVGENVAGIINWNEGMVFEQICADLEAEGYQVAPLVLPACSQNAPHKRDRTWFVAKRTAK